MARSVFIDLIGHDRASGAFNTAAASADRAAARMSSASAKMTRAGAAMTRSITVPVVAAIAVSAKLATDFNTSMTRIQTQAGASARDVQILSKQVLNLKNAQQGPNELAKALYHLKSVGMTNKSAMSALRQSMNLANVSGASLEDTTNALAGAWRTGIKGATDFKGTVSSLNAIIGSGNMTATDLIGALGTGILPTAKTFGLTIRDVGAALALFTDEGVPADAAATRIRMSFSLLGAGSAAAEKQLKGIGLTSLRLNEDMRKPNGLLVAITDLKKHLDDSGLSAARQSQVLSHAFGGGRSSSGILSMINNLDVLGQKYQQQAALSTKFGAAVAAQAKTPAAQFHMLTAELQKTGVILGNTVLPYLVTGAKDVTGIVKGFQGLSDTKKSIVLWSIGILAAMGPVLSIGGKLGLLGAKMDKFAVGAASSIARLSGASEATAARVTSITTGMVRGVSAILVGSLAGQFGGTSGGGWLASILLGGAGAWAITGNPVMGAIGAVSAVITKGIGLWNDHKNAAKAAAEAEAGFVSNLTSAINADNGALGANLRLTVTKQLQDSGILNEAQKLGFNLASTVSAAMGNDNAKKSIGAAISKQVADARSMLDRILKPLGLFNEQGQLNALLSGAAPFDPNHLMNAKTGNAMHLSASQIADAKAAIAAAQGADKYGAALGRMGIDINQARSKADQFSHALNDNRVNTGSLSAQLESLRKHTSTAVDANGQFTSSLRLGTVVGDHNRTTLVNMALAAEKLAAGSKHSDSALKTSIKSIEDTAVKAGFTRSSVDNLIQSLGLFGRLHPRATLDANNAPASAKIHAVGRALYALNAQKADPTVTVNDLATNRLRQLIGYLHVFGQGASATVTVSTPTGIVHVDPNHAAGGWIYGPGSGTSDSIPARLSNGEFVVRASQANKYRGLLENMNKGVAGFASGGSVNTKAAQAAAAQRASVGTVRGDFGPLLGSLRGTIVDLRTAFWAMFRDARSAHTSKDVLDGITASYRRLIPMIERRNALTVQLTKAETALAAVRAKYAQVWTTSRDASMGSFDITTAGGSQFTDRPGTTAGSILANLRATAAKAGQFRTVLARLVKEGLNRNLVAQLAAAGPGALAQAQALALSTPAQMRSLNSAYSGLSVTSSAIGKLAATDMYGAGVQSAQGLVNGLRSRQTVLNAAIARIANGMIAELKKTLGIHSPSRVMYGLAGHTVEGYRRGIVDRLDDVRRAGKDMGNAAVPGSQAASWSAGSGRPAEIHIHGIDDPQSVATAVMRRMALPGYGSA